MMTFYWGPLLIGLILAINVGLAVDAPTPLKVGCAVLSGCMFMLTLTIFAKLP